MLMGKNRIQETHYDILSIKEDASYEEIRASYRCAILNSHPDKLHKSPETPDSNFEVKDRFLKVQEAWEILSDSRSRAAYDSELRTSRMDTDIEVTEDVGLEDMMVEDDGQVVGLFYQCRCGDCFSVDSLELEEMGCRLLREESSISLQRPDALPASFVLPCGSCSLKIRLLINVDNTLPVDDQL